MRVGFWIGFSFLTLMFAAVLELNKNTIAGWILFAILICAFIILYVKVLASKPWYLKLLGWILYVALLFVHSCQPLIFNLFPFILIMVSNSGIRRKTSQSSE